MGRPRQARVTLGEVMAHDADADPYGIPTPGTTNDHDHSLIVDMTPGIVPGFRLRFDRDFADEVFAAMLERGLKVRTPSEAVRLCASYGVRHLLSMLGNGKADSLLMRAELQDLLNIEAEAKLMRHEIDHLRAEGRDALADMLERELHGVEDLEEKFLQKWRG